MTGQVAVGDGVADVAGVDDQAPFVAEEGGVEAGPLGGGGEGGDDGRHRGDLDGAEEALVLGERGRTEVCHAENFCRAGDEETRAAETASTLAQGDDDAAGAGAAGREPNQRSLSSLGEVEPRSSLLPWGVGEGEHQVGLESGAGLSKSAVRRGWSSAVMGPRAPRPEDVGEVEAARTDRSEDAAEE